MITAAILEKALTNVAQSLDDAVCGYPGVMAINVMSTQRVLLGRVAEELNRLLGPVVEFHGVDGSVINVTIAGGNGKPGGQGFSDEEQAALEEQA